MISPSPPKSPAPGEVFVGDDTLLDSDTVLGDIGTPVTTPFFLRGGGNDTVGTSCVLQEGYWLGCPSPGGSAPGRSLLPLGVRSRSSNSRRACRFGDITKLLRGGNPPVSVMRFVPGWPGCGWKASLVRAERLGLSINKLQSFSTGPSSSVQFSVSTLWLSVYPVTLDRPIRAVETANPKSISRRLVGLVEIPRGRSLDGFGDLVRLLPS